VLALLGRSEHPPEDVEALEVAEREEREAAPALAQAVATGEAVVRARVPSQTSSASSAEVRERVRYFFSQAA
jgi:hypothetical protein